LPLVRRRRRGSGTALPVPDSELGGQERLVWHGGPSSSSRYYTISIELASRFVLHFYKLLKGGAVPVVVVGLTMLGIASVVSLFSTGALWSVGNPPHAPHPAPRRWRDRDEQG
jgi:hypothetical protein